MLDRTTIYEFVIPRQTKKNENTGEWSLNIRGRKGTDRGNKNESYVFIIYMYMSSSNISIVCTYMYHVQERIKSGNVLYFVIPCALSVRQIQLKCEVKKYFVI